MENKEVIDIIKRAFELNRQEAYKQALEMLYKALSIEPDNVEVLLQVASTHAKLKNFSSATTLYEKLLDIYPEDIDVLEHVINYYLEIKELNKVRFILAKFTLKVPTQKAFEIYLSSLLKMLDYQQAVDIYNEKNLDKYNDAKINKFYAIALCQINKFEEAKNIISTLVGTALYDSDLKYYHAKVLFELDNKNRAKKILKEIENIEQSAKIYNLLGEIELRNDNTEFAINYFTKATKLELNDLFCFNLATAYQLNGQFDEAKEFYLKAVSLEPFVPEYKYAQAYLFYTLGEYTKALKITEELILEYPQLYSAVVLLAQIFLAEKKYFKAENVLAQYEGDEDNLEYLKALYMISKALYKYDKAVIILQKINELYPSIDYKFELAELYYKLQKVGEAKNILTDVLRKSPNYVNALLLMSQIYLDENNVSEVYKLLELIFNLDINNKTAYFIKLKLLILEQKYNEAIQVGKMILEYEPKNDDIYANIAFCYAQLKEYDVALNYYQEAIMLNENNADYFLKLALINDYLGNDKEAIRYLLFAHNLKPENKEISSRLVDIYNKNKNYKQALAVLLKQYELTRELEIRKLLKNQINEVENNFKKSVSPLVYASWKLFKA